MTSKKEILDILSQNRELLRERFHVRKIALFGSYARDEASDESDVDLLVDMPSSFDRYFDLKEFLEKKLGTKVDLGKEKTIRPFIRNRIKEELIYV